MAELAKESVVMSDFPGLFTNVDRQDIGAGAASAQENITCIEQATLIVRHGWVLLQFED